MPCIKRPEGNNLLCKYQQAYYYYYDTALACYNFDLHQLILIIFGRNVVKKVRSQMVLYYSTSPN